MTILYIFLCVLICINTIMLSNSWRSIRRHASYHAQCYRHFVTRQSEDYILRVCTGPACSNFNPSFTYSRLQTDLTDFPDLRVWRNYFQIFFSIGIFSAHLWQIKTIDCLSACKRGCNVALIPKGECAGVIYDYQCMHSLYYNCQTTNLLQGEYIEGMNSVEKMKGVFNKVNSEESITRVSSCIKKHFGSINTWSVYFVVYYFSLFYPLIIRYNEKSYLQVTNLIFLINCTAN